MTIPQFLPVEPYPVHPAFPAEGEASTGNTTTTPLAGGATFTGTAEQNNYPDAGVSCYSDTAGTLYFDFSVNGTDWRTFPTGGYVIDAGIHEFHIARKLSREFRVRFVNGASAQTTFQLSTYYGQYGNTVAPLNQPLGLDADAILVRPTYTWLDISRGLTSGMRVVKKFGRNAAVGTSFSTVTTSGTYKTPTAPVSLEFVSNNIGDALNGTGMHEITISGIDTNWDEQVVTVAAHPTAGTTAVAIPGTWLRVYRAFVSKSGNYASMLTGGSHLGVITVREAGAGATWNSLIVDGGFGVGQSLIGCYTIPRNYTAYVFPAEVGVDSGKTCDVAFFTRENADDVTSTYSGTMRARSYLTGIAGGNPFNRSGMHIPLGPIVGPADIGYLSKVSTGTGAVSVEFEIFLVNE